MKILPRKLRSFIQVLGMGMLIPLVVSAQIENPLGGGTNTLTGILQNVIGWLLGLVGMLALLSLVVGGIRLIVAFGREDGVKSAKQMIFWSVIGLVVVLLSLAVITIVERLLRGT